VEKALARLAVVVVTVMVPAVFLTALTVANRPPGAAVEAEPTITLLAVRALIWAGAGEGQTKVPLTSEPSAFMVAALSVTVEVLRATVGVTGLAVVGLLVN